MWANTVPIVIPIFALKVERLVACGRHLDECAVYWCYIYGSQQPAYYSFFHLYDWYGGGFLSHQALGVGLVSGELS